MDRGLAPHSVTVSETIHLIKGMADLEEEIPSGN